MNCPKCGGITKIIRSKTNCECTFRRRECLECHYRYTTIELEKDLADNLGIKTKHINDDEDIFKETE